MEGFFPLFQLVGTFTGLPDLLRINIKDYKDNFWTWILYICHVKKDQWLKQMD